MNNFLTCRGFGGWSLLSAAFLWSVVSHASPQISSLTLTSTGSDEALEAQMTLAFDQEKYDCIGGVVLGQISMLICGDQRQAQAEFQSFNENKNAVLAVYQPGRQQGYLFLMKKQENGYAAIETSLVLTPGFGSLRLFERYILEPMKADFTEDQVFKSLPLMMKVEGPEVSISTLRDRVANKEHLKFKAPEEELEEETPEVPVKEDVQEEIKKEEAPKEESPKVETPKAETPAPVKEEPSEVKPAPQEPEEEGEVIRIPPPKEEKRPVTKRPTPKPRDSHTVRIIRGPNDVEEVRVPRHYSPEDPFGNSIPRRRVIRNPRGYDLRNMTLEQIEDLERRGLIYREDD